MRASQVVGLALLLVSSFAVGGCAVNVDASGSQSSGVENTDLTIQYEAIRTKATRLAGEPLDIPQRAIFLHQIYVDSNGNDTFPEVALHGALWANSFFSDMNELQAIADTLGLDEFGTLDDLQTTADRFAFKLQSANRAVFIDTYTNYYFTKKFGTAPGANRFISDDLLAALNNMHARTAAGDPLTLDERRSLFNLSLLWEQEGTVAPRVTEAAGEIQSDTLRALMLRPIVRFKYFPFMKVYFFKDFSSKDERIAHALDSNDTAERVGWDRVADSMSDYRALPDAYFADREGYAQALEKELLSE